MTPYAIFGGTFDPIHLGHLQTVDEVATTLGLEHVNFIPAATPPHRDPPVAAPGHRWRMAALATAEFPRLHVDVREINRLGPSYTVDTLEELREEKGPYMPLCLILGMDAFAGLPHWHRWQAIPDLAHLVVMHRPGETTPDEQRWWQNRFSEDHSVINDSPAGAVTLVDITPVDISSTWIRQLLSAGEPITHLVPRGVEHYIQRHSLYT